MRLIVTRPEPAAGKTAKKLRALGHDVIISPVLEIVDSGLDMPAGVFSAILVTSSNALRVMKSRGIDEILLQTPLYVAGDRTAEKARETGFENVHSASGNAGNLVELLNDDADLIGGGENPLLYVCGADATSGFLEDLEKLGLQVISWINYKAILVDQLTHKSVELLISGNPVGVVLYSARSARQFSQLLMAQIPTQHFDNIEFYSISENVKKALALPLQKQCLVANNPDEASLFELIQV